jgi:hypothetical protein
VSASQIVLTAAYTGTPTTGATAQEGVIQNDNAGHVVLDGAGGYHLLLTSWGNSGNGAANINVQYKHETAVNLLDAGAVLESLMQVPLLPAIPDGGGTYDPFIANNGTNWYLGYTIGPVANNSYYPALALTDAGSEAGLAGGWTAVGQDPTNATLYEGTSIVYLNGSYWLLAGSLYDSQVYDLNMNYQGKYQSLVLDGGATYGPHPMLVPAGNYVYQTTFDGRNYNGNAANVGHLRELRSWRWAPGGH